MSLPDANKMIADLPGALTASVRDASGGLHVAALTQTVCDPQLTEQGVAFAGTADTLYVAKPFAFPAGDKIDYTDAGGRPHRRRVDSVTDNVVFLAIALGEETA